MSSELGKLDKDVVKRCLNNSIHRRILCNLNNTGVTSAEALSERDLGVSLPSLYRALDTLKDEGVVSEIKVDKKRASATTYSLSPEFLDFINAVMMNKDPENYLMVAAWQLQNVHTDFQVYLNKPDSDIHRDLAGVGSIDICVSDEELTEFHKKLFELLKEHMKPEEEGCKKRTITISIGPPRA